MAMSAFPACFNAHGVLTTPDGSFSFTSSSGKSKAEIQFAKVGDVWIAEYRFRLTPRECARIQGFPESFKPHPAASQACKQFGNSVAAHVVAAIAAAAAAGLRA